MKGLPTSTQQWSLSDNYNNRGTSHPTITVSNQLPLQKGTLKAYYANEGWDAIADQSDEPMESLINDVYSRLYATADNCTSKY